MDHIKRGGKIHKNELYKIRRNTMKRICTTRNNGYFGLKKRNQYRISRLKLAKQWMIIL